MQFPNSVACPEARSCEEDFGIAGLVRRACQILRIDSTREAMEPLLCGHGEFRLNRDSSARAASESESAARVGLKIPPLVIPVLPQSDSEMEVAMQIYDIPQIAAMLRLSVKTVRLYLATGKLIGRKVGKRWLVTQDALRAFMDADHNAKAS